MRHCLLYVLHTLCIKGEKGALWASQHSSPKRPEGPQDGAIYPTAVLHPQNTAPPALIYTQTDHQVQARWRRGGQRAGGDKNSLKVLNSKDGDGPGPSDPKNFI